MNKRLYSHTTDGGAQYLCANHIDECDEGDLGSAIIRMDGEPEFLSPLYAAAPDLYAALEDIIADMDDFGITYASINKARAAIAKAQEG